MNIEQFLQNHLDEIHSIRRMLHQCAELATLEYETGTIIRRCLEEWKIPYDYPVAETGIVAEIWGKGKPDNNSSDDSRRSDHERSDVNSRHDHECLNGNSRHSNEHSHIDGCNSHTASPKTVALRADMDALPIYEDRSHPFSSKNPGVMHACGHDAHMAIALGAARYFKEIEHHFSGCVKIFFEPAEETIGGAKCMVDEGCMERPRVDYVIGLHVAPYLKTGEIEVKYDNLYAASDEVTITVKGKGCHGAYPDTGVDAMVIAAQLILALQTVISRSIPPADPCVLSLGTIRGGSARNVIADTVELGGILRTANPALRSQLKKQIADISRLLPQALGGEGRAVFSPGYDALINTNALVDLLVDTAAPILGRACIHWKPAPGMGVEDFSHFLTRAPGVFYHLGCWDQTKGPAAPLHSRDFLLDEHCIAYGIRLQTALAGRLLGIVPPYAPTAPTSSFTSEMPSSSK